MKELLERIADIQAAAVVDYLVNNEPVCRDISLYGAIRMSRRIQERLMGSLTSEIGKDFQLKPAVPVKEKTT